MQEKNEELEKVLKECSTSQADNKPKKKKMTKGDKFLIAVIILAVICMGVRIAKAIMKYLPIDTEPISLMWLKTRTCNLAKMWYNN